MTTLVLGGNGYIGSYLTPYLISEGIDTISYGRREKAHDFNLLSKDFLDYFETIVLVAGHSSVPSCEGPLKSSWNNNVRNFHNLIEKIEKDQRIIYASSSSVYGNKSKKLYVETDCHMDFINNYDLTKVALDNVALNNIHAGKNIIGLRFGTVNGGSPLLRRDIMLNSMVFNALVNKKIFISNKQIARPIFSIKDLGRAMATIIKQEWKSGFYNLASFNSTVEEMAQVVLNRVGGEIIDKGTTLNAYDFRIDSSKFAINYNFKFNETVESVVEDLVDCYKYRNPTIVMRDTYFDYQG